MFNSKIASLEARIARLESRISKSATKFRPKDPFKTFFFPRNKINADTIIQMIDARTKRVEAEDTLSSFYINNAEDEETIDALNQLASGIVSEVSVATGQGFVILKVVG
jgi:hypothetical protein